LRLVNLVQFDTISQLILSTMILLSGAHCILFFPSEGLFWLVWLICEASEMSLSDPISKSSPLSRMSSTVLNWARNLKLKKYFFILSFDQVSCIAFLLTILSFFLPSEDWSYFLSLILLSFYFIFSYYYFCSLHFWSFWIFSENIVKCDKIFYRVDLIANADLLCL
jgi:hypothetical protein